MGKDKIRYLVTRIKKNHKLYYWLPKQDLVKQGWKSVNLGRSGLDEPMPVDVKNKAIELNHRLDEWRKGNQSDIYVKKYTVAWLIREYKQEDRYQDLREATRSGYDRQLNILEEWVGNFLVTDIKRVHVMEKYKALVAASKSKGHGGISAGRDFIRAIRPLFRFAMDLDLIQKNPADGLRVKQLKSRKVVFEDEEISQLIEKAIHMGRPSIATALMLYIFTGQRVSDIRGMSWSQYNGSTIEVKQNKGGKEVTIHCLPELQSYLASVPKESVYILVNEETKQPYTKDSFEKVFAKIRNADVEGYPPLRKELQMRDLRRTAVVFLFRAGCTDAEVASITGHSIEACKRILDVYFPPNAIVSKNASVKLQEYREKLKRF